MPDSPTFFENMVLKQMRDEGILPPPEFPPKTDRKQPTKNTMKYKVWFRQVYTETFRQWVAEMILCHVYYRLSPPPKSNI